MVRMRTLPGARGAISPVISTLIIVATVFAMFAIVFSWATPNLTLTQSLAALWYGGQGEAARERLTVEMIHFNQTSGTIDLYVRNVGEIDVKIVAVYLNGSDVTGQVTPTLGEGYRLYAQAPGAQSVAKLSINHAWVKGQTYHVKVVTARGGWASATAIA